MTLHALYRIADLVAHFGQPADLYEPAVDAMIAATRADRASILVFDDAGVMRFKAWRHLSDRYREAVDGHSPWTPDAQGANPILVPDVSTEPSLGPLCDVILSEGIQALAFIPIGHHGRLLGKFMVYYDQPHDFSDLDLKIASMVTHYVAFGLDRVRAESEISELLQREREALREAETLNRAKDDFLAMLSHELRNPLNAIANAVTVLDQTSRPAGAPAKAQEVIRRQTAFGSTPRRPIGRSESGPRASRLAARDHGSAIFSSIDSREPCAPLYGEGPKAAGVIARASRDGERRPQPPSASHHEPSR